MVIFMLIFAIFSTFAFAYYEFRITVQTSPYPREGRTVFVPQEIYDKAQELRQEANMWFSYSMFGLTSVMALHWLTQVS